jgi:RNA recognition motif-containing protein
MPDSPGVRNGTKWSLSYRFLYQNAACMSLVQCEITRRILYNNNNNNNNNKAQDRIQIFAHVKMSESSFSVILKPNNFCANKKKQMVWNCVVKTCERGP